MSDRQEEIEIRPLDDAWVEVRMVYRVTPDQRDRPHRATGASAMHDIVYFALAFTANIARGFHEAGVAEALEELGARVHQQSGCTCGETRH